MKIKKRKVDNDYINFLYGYFITLKRASETNKFMGYNVYYAVRYMITRKFGDVLKTGKVPDKIKENEYSFIEGANDFLPPKCCWVSKSGNFSSHDLYYLLNIQSYILWDIKRKVVLPMIFHDMPGMDEKNNILFCRTLPGNDFHSGQCNLPLRINTKWINMTYYLKSNPKDYHPYYPDKTTFTELSNEQQRDCTTKDIIYLRFNDNEITNFYFIEQMEELLKKLVYYYNNKEQKSYFVKKIFDEFDLHPSIFLYDKEEITQIISNITTNKTTRRLIIEKLFPNKTLDTDDLPF